MFPIISKTILNFKRYTCFSKLIFRHKIVIPKSRSTNFCLPNKKKYFEKDEDYDKFVGPVFLQIIGSGAQGAPRSLYFFSHQHRYLFNAGEGSQRLANEHKVKINRLEHVFITNPVWENIGGLLGSALTIQEFGTTELTIHGPKGVDALFGVSCGFVNLEFMKVKMADCEKDTVYADSVVTVNYVLLESNEKHRLEKEEQDFFCGSKLVEDTIDYYAHLKTKRSNVPGQKTDNYKFKDTEHLSHKSMAYICQLIPKKGKLNLSACVDKNVPPGPLLSKLSNGEDVTLPCGTFVKVEDVSYPCDPGSVFIVIDCPNEGFLDALVNENAFKKYQNVTNKTDIPQYIIHFTPSRIMENERYRKWMESFPDETLHVNANDYNKCLGSVGCHETQYKLNIIDKKIFPLLNHEGIPVVNLPKCETEEEEIDRFLEKTRRRNAGIPEDSITRNRFNFPDNMGHTLRCLPLRNFSSLECHIPDCIYLTPEEYTGQVIRDPDFHSTMDMLNLELKKLPVIENPKPFPRIIFLGTGSSVPNKHRNASSILVTLEKDEHLLLDCGEGTYSQFVRHFGYERTQKILAHTKVIFVSHMHADHHLGLITVINERRKAIQKLGVSLPELILSVPHTMLYWLTKYHNFFEKILIDVEIISNKELEYRHNYDHYRSKILSVLPLKEYSTTYVSHCPHAFGVSFTDLNGIKVTYSGDTMPDKNLIELGMNSSILIHEATFEDELIAEAAAKFHSTFGQAIASGRKMNADFTLLTHFSQRYAKILPEIDTILSDRVGVAFDHMEVTLDDLPKLHLHKNMLKIIFNEDLESMERNQLRRRRTMTLLTE